MTFALSILVAYLLGAINCAVIVCQLMGLPSPYSVGSGNPGATNVKRLGGTKPAALTLFGDLIKGLLPVAVAHWVLHLPEAQLGWVALAAVLGHMFPVYFKFKGGKGVATTIGVLIGLHPLLGALFVITWLFIAKAFRISSLSALIAMLLTPLYYTLIGGHQAWLPIVLITILVLVRHHSNIRRLMQKTEH